MYVGASWVASIVQSSLLAWAIGFENGRPYFQLLTLTKNKHRRHNERKIVRAPVQERYLVREVVQAPTTASKHLVLMTGGYLQFFQEDWIFYFWDKSIVFDECLYDYKSRSANVYFAFEHTDSSFCSSSFEMLSLVILTLHQCGTKGVNLSGAYWTVRNQERSKSASKCIWRLKVKCLSSQARRQHAVATSQGAMCLSRFGRRSVLDCESRSARCVQASIILSSILFNGWSSQGRRQQHRDKASNVLSFWTKERACCEEYRRIPDSSFCFERTIKKAWWQRTVLENWCAPDLRTTPGFVDSQSIDESIFTIDWRTKMDGGRCETQTTNRKTIDVRIQFVNHLVKHLYFR